MLTDNNQIFRELLCYHLLSSHKSFISNKCIIVEPNELSLNYLLYGSDPWGTVGHSYSIAAETFVFLPGVPLSILILLFSQFWSVSTSYFIIVVFMRQRIYNHSCMSSTFTIVLLNGCCSLRSAKTARSGSSAVKLCSKLTNFYPLNEYLILKFMWLFRNIYFLSV